MKTARFALIAALVALVSSLAVPTTGGAAQSVRAIALKAPAPAWYTPELHKKVLASGIEGVPVPAGATMPGGTAIPASSVAFLGIRPGQFIIVGGGTLCSSNFVFRNGANYAIGTAGHCGEVGDQVTMIALGNVLFNIGTITKSTGDAGIGNDFALISIKPQFNSKVSPSMAHWGGPIGQWTSGVPLLVKHSGHGLGIGTGGTPRLGVGLTWAPSGLWRFAGAINKGDSGSGATSQNRAVGNITHIVLTIPPTNAGTSITRMIQIAGLPLATCSRALPWPLFGCPSL